MKEGTQERRHKNSADMCWRVPSVVILVWALNMHGDSEGFTGLYPLSSIDEVAPRGKRWGKEQRHLGNRIAWQCVGSWLVSLFTLRNTFSVAAAQRKMCCIKTSYLHLPPFYSVPHVLSGLSLHTCSRSSHVCTQPILPSFINFCHADRHWWKLFTHCQERLCVSPCADLLLYWCCY